MDAYAATQSSLRFTKYHNRKKASMNTTTKSNKQPTTTQFEAIESPGDGVSTTPVGVTEYESPKGLDPNNTDPNRESSNAGVAPACSGENESGFTGTSGDEPAPAAELDAIVGSYPELEDVARVIIGPDERIRGGPSVHWSSPLPTTGVSSAPGGWSAHAPC